MNDLTNTFVITSLTFLVAGATPAVISHYLLRTKFIGGVWAGMLVGVLGAVLGGLLVTLLEGIPDMLVIAKSVDIVPPLFFGVLITVLYGLISRSNRR